MSRASRKPGFSRTFAIGLAASLLVAGAIGRIPSTRLAAVADPDLQSAKDVQATEGKAAPDPHPDKAS